MDPRGEQNIFAIGNIFSNVWNMDILAINKGGNIVSTMTGNRE